MPKQGEFDFVPCEKIRWDFWQESIARNTSARIFQWIDKADGKSLKKSKAVYRVKGPAHKWQEINNRAEMLCEFMNKHDPKMETFYGKKSETI